MIGATNQFLTAPLANCPSKKVGFTPFGCEAGRDMVTAQQVRAARALLDWSQGTLAEAAQVSLTTVKGFETGRSSPRPVMLTAIQRALEDAGIVFSERHGVSLREG